ncbi:hypothetical protein M8C21_022899 [Ambrosia artemisiifolia]|uniref:Uncharacterized protein n=1 Tax=Ambrosia artemisiifolia TaxID=4212 RepID=A0AAD5CID8_AMBAR|nr:hypothetical protein M8C21_022899 [Ambrosia artemisiifolia]
MAIDQVNFIQNSSDEGEADVNGDGEGNVDALATTMNKNMKHLYNKTDPILVLADNELDVCNELVKKLGYGSNITATTVGLEPKIGIAKERLQQLQAMKIKNLSRREKRSEESDRKEKELDSEGKEKGWEPKRQEKAPDGEDKRLDPTCSIIVLFEPTFPDVNGKWDAPKTIKLIRSRLKAYFTTAISLSL